MQAEMIRIGGEIVNVNQIARVLWQGRTLWVNTSGGFVKLEGRQASMTWAMLEDRLIMPPRSPASRDSLPPGGDSFPLGRPGGELPSSGA